MKMPIRTLGFYEVFRRVEAKQDVQRLKASEKRASSAWRTR